MEDIDKAVAVKGQGEGFEVFILADVRCKPISGA